MLPPGRYDQADTGKLTVPILHDLLMLKLPLYLLPKTMDRASTLSGVNHDIVEGNNTFGIEKAAINVKVQLDPIVAVITINEQKIDFIALQNGFKPFNGL